jgi:tyrosyl-tRNA synthetase
MSDFFGELKERGFIAQVTNSGLEKAIEGKKLTFYLGIDPTADSLHIGHMVPLMLAAHLQRKGHRPIILVGGGTGLIGDPSQKAQERPLLPKEQVEKNVAGIKKQLGKILDLSGKNAAVVVNNADWLASYKLVSFLREIGKHFTVNEMLGRESIKQRLINREQGISFTEFSYMMLQAADYLELFRKYCCQLQIGGTDQWGNIVAGVDLIKRKLNKAVHALVVPLLTRSDGKKFGKTEAGAIWLDPKKTSPYQMYQYWLNVPDKDAIRLLKLFTFLSLEEVSKIEGEFRENPAGRKAQRVLAYQFTKMIHGARQAKAVAGACRFLFDKIKKGFTADEITCLLSAAPSVKISKKMIKEGLAIEEAMVLAGLAKSKNEAKRMISQGGVYLNHQRCSSEDKVTSESFISGKLALLRAGKKRYSLLILK